jgi:hypothetical protein
MHKALRCELDLGFFSPVKYISVQLQQHSIIYFPHTSSLFVINDLTNL